MKKQLIAHIAQQLKSYGYTVYIAKTGEYGFYTDGVKVVSFGGHWTWSVDFSGNYKTDVPKQSGTGWQLPGGKELTNIDSHTAECFIKATAPSWATRGAKRVDYITPEQHLKTYSGSSHYHEFTPDGDKVHYLAQFHGRKVGAIGITYEMEAYVSAADETSALIELYKQHEHISFCKFTPLDYDPKFANTAAAIRKYDAGQAGRNAAWAAVEEQAHIEAADAADKAALEMVQLAFYADTKEINSRDNCLLVDIGFMRRVTFSKKEG